MKRSIMLRGVLLGVAWAVAGGIGGPGGPWPASAQDPRADYSLIDQPDLNPHGMWCPPPDTVLTAPGGRLRAVNYSRDYQGDSDVLAGSVLMIFEEYRLINAVVNLAAVAWEPDGEKLLVHETTRTEDAKWFILDVGEGQYDKTGPERQRTALGSKAYRFMAWPEPETIIFLDSYSGAEVRVPVR